MFKRKVKTVIPQADFAFTYNGYNVPGTMFEKGNIIGVSKIKDVKTGDILAIAMKDNNTTELRQALVLQDETITLFPVGGKGELIKLEPYKPNNFYIVGKATFVMSKLNVEN